MTDPLKFVVETGKRNRWAVVGQKGSIELWYTKIDGYDYLGNGRMYGGVEWHCRHGDGEPSQTNCDLNNGNCWHDGSSLAFDEYRHLLFDEENISPQERDRIIERRLTNLYYDWT